MGSVKNEIEAEHAQLRQRLGARHAKVVQREAGGEDFMAEYARLLHAADKLLAFEQTLPAKLAEPERQVSERIVRTSWFGQAAISVALIVLVFALDHSAWWLVVLVPHTIAILSFAFQKVTAKNHRFYRHLTIGLHLECTLIVLIALSVISLWFVILAIIGWIVLGVAASEGPGDTAAKKGDRR